MFYNKFHSSRQPFFKTEVTMVADRHKEVAEILIVKPLVLKTRILEKVMIVKPNIPKVDFQRYVRQITKQDHEFSPWIGSTSRFSGIQYNITRKFSTTTTKNSLLDVLKDIQDIPPSFRTMLIFLSECDCRILCRY